MELRRLFPFLLALSLLAACGPRDTESATQAGPAAQSNAQSGASTATTTEGGSEEASRIRVEVEGEPTVGPATVVVFLLQADGEGLTGATVEVTGDMTHAGMMPVVAMAEEAESGLYRTEDFRFTMAGDWILTAQIELPDGSTSTTEERVTVASP